MQSCGESTVTIRFSSNLPSREIINMPIATTGCGIASPIKPGTSHDEMIRSNGLLRIYHLHIPSGYQANQAQALLLDFHGHDSNGTLQERYTGFSELADQDHFIVVYPQGTRGPDNETGWASGGPKDPTIDDVLFVSDLLNHLQATFCIDPRRIYATGISNGGGMVGLLACKLSGRLAAFAPVAGSFYPISGECQPSRPTPLLEFHGTADPVVPYEGNSHIDLPPIPRWLQEWAKRDGCMNTPIIFFQKAGVTGENWRMCRGNTAIVHYRINGGGHTWPGATIDKTKYGATTHTIDATTLICQFFATHPLPSSLAGPT